MIFDNYFRLYSTNGGVIMASLYTKIVKAAQSKKMSIRKLERQAGLSNGTIAKWKQADPSYPSIIKVANVLGVSTDYFREESFKQSR